MRARTITAIVVLGAALIAVGASADFRSVPDPRGDVKCYDHNVSATVPCSHLASKARNADIVSATAGHDGALLKHTIRVVGRAPQAGWLRINTDSDPGCEWIATTPGKPEMYSGFEPCAGEPNASAPFCCARVHRYDGPPRSVVHKTVITFKWIGSPRSYGWSYETEAGGEAFDHVPNGGGYIRHRLG
jgi:hypothetical protein